MTDGVDASVDEVEASAPDTAVDRLAARTEDDELPAADHPVLCAGELGDNAVRGALTSHIDV